MVRLIEVPRMKRIIVAFLIMTMLLATACGRVGVDTITEETSSVETFVVPTVTRTSEAVTTATFEEYSIEYDIDQTYLNVSFEDIYNLCEEWAGVDFENLVQNAADNTILSVNANGYDIVYIHDYSDYLEMMTRPDDATGDSLYQPEEYEYHILRRIYVNGLFISEFEDNYWAEVAYCKAYDSCSEEYGVLDESDLNSGYFYSYRELTREYCAFYISNNCRLSYSHSLNQSDNSEYISYLEICELTGLPTCSEMTEAIGVQ